MIAIHILVALVLLGVASIEGKANKSCDHHPIVTCERHTSPRWHCPNTYGCHRASGKCCRYKQFPANCNEEIEKETQTPYRCRGGGSQRCSDGFTCVWDKKNRFSVCCEDFICYDKSANVHRKHEGKWTESDNCTVCKCISNNRTRCDVSECQNKCGDYSAFSPCPLKTCGKRIQIRKCKNSKSDLVSQRNAELNMVICHPQPPAQCPQPGVALTEKHPIITGGIEVSPKFNYRWMVHIAYDNSVHCGGTILSRLHILTAAHCFVNKETAEQMTIDYIHRFITVKTGKHNLTQTEEFEQNHTIKSVILHKDYNTYAFDIDGDNDIAIVVLESELEFNEHTHPIKLPTEPFNKTMKKLKKGLCRVVGWGMIKKAKFKYLYTNVLMMADINIEENCTFKLERDYNRMTGNMFCASAVDDKSVNSRLDSCHGDSGGPLMCREGTTWYQYGIVSWGPRDGSCGKQSGAYIKVSNYIDWIRTTISTDGGWGEFSAYSPCSVSCEGGIKSRVRACTNPPPIGDGTCGGGIKSRVRACTNPPPIGDGTCSGYTFKTMDGEMVNVEDEKCNTRPCEASEAYDV